LTQQTLLLRPCPTPASKADPGSRQIRSPVHSLRTAGGACGETQVAREQMEKRWEDVENMSGMDQYPLVI